MESPILVEQKSVFTIITLNRPERRNALNIELMTQLVDAIGAANKDTTRRAIILCGAGQGFCAGLDLKQAQEADNHSASAQAVANMIKTVHTSKLPTIAAVHGHAMAGGAGLMAACDLAVCAAGTTIGYPEVRRGLVPALISTMLTRQLGDRRLRELMFCAEPITAERALEFGLVNRVVPGGRDEALAEAIKLATTVAKGSPQALASTKELLLALRPHPLNEDMKRAYGVHDQARHSTDAAEGIAAFMEKRSPKWAAGLE